MQRSSARRERGRSRRSTATCLFAHTLSCGWAQPKECRNREIRQLGAAIESERERESAKPARRGKGAGKPEREREQAATGSFALGRALCGLGPATLGWEESRRFCTSHRKEGTTSFGFAENREKRERQRGRTGTPSRCCPETDKVRTRGATWIGTLRLCLW